MIDTAVFALVAAGVVITIGFFGNYMFRRTGFPDMLILIGLGVLLGPVLKLFDPSGVVALAPYMSALALVFILFDGGLSMNIYQVFSASPRAVLLASTGFLLSVLSVTAVMYYLFAIPFLYALLFGTTFGGSSSVIVIYLAQRIGVSEQCSIVVSLESALTDILCIVISLAIIEIIQTGQAEYLIITQQIASRFATGAVVGVLLGVFWLWGLPRLIKEPYSYMLTLAIVIFAYSISEYLGGSGALSSLCFGLVLGNEKEIYGMLKRNVGFKLVDKKMKRFESEITFLVRTFFFVYLGLIATFSEIGFLFMGIIISCVLFLVRFAAVYIGTWHSELKKESFIMSTLIARGLAAAVLATLPLQLKLLYADTFVNLAIIVIMLTAMICTVSLFLFSRKSKRKTPRS